jgi:hypothetical protein
LTKYALLIAVEKYQATDIKSVRYANADATKLAQVLGTLGFEVKALLDGEATKTAVEFQVKKFAERLRPDDQFFLFFAGHGYAENDVNYLACHDMQRGGLSATSVRLQRVFDLLKQSKCKKCAVFLDACHSGLEIDEGMRSILTELSTEDLEKFLTSADFCVCFASCRVEQRSYSLTRLGHGVWSYCLIEALSGRASDAIERKRFVTANSLQAYLSDEVPRELRKDRPHDIQTPWLAGGLSRDFLIADVGELVAAQRKPNPFTQQQLRRVAFRAKERGKIKSLGGFVKARGHYVPKEVDSKSSDFVQTIAIPDLDADLNEMHDLIKENLGYVRKDMIKREVLEGTGSIETPDFHYSVSVTQHPDNSSEYLITREIYNIRNFDKVASDAFNVVFGRWFNRLQFEFAEELDLPNFIDECEAKKISVRYDADWTYCELEFEEHPASIIVRDRSIEFVHTMAKEPRLLVSAFQEFRVLAASQNLKMLTE